MRTAEISAARSGHVPGGGADVQVEGEMAMTTAAFRVGAGAASRGDSAEAAVRALLDAYRCTMSSAWLTCVRRE